jgi:hypothetical protein
MDKAQIQNWWKVLTSTEPFPGDFERPVLLSVDADRVAEYVFETPGLSELRGASAQLDDLNNIRPVLAKLGIPDECLVYAAGGSAVVVAPESKACSLKDALERAYPDLTGAATATCVTSEVSPLDVREHFGDLVRSTGAHLRVAKGQKAAVPFFEVLPFTRRCDACRKRPAVEFIKPFADEPSESRCRVCKAKWQMGKERRSKWHQKLGIEKAPQDLETIGDVSGGTIGMIYADANKMGDWIQAAGTLEEFRKRSDTVRRAVDVALISALKEHCLKQPFEVILVGGDDVLLITPACVALEVAMTLCERFAAEMQHYAKSMSAAVVLADHHTPVYFLQRLVGQLLKETKRRCSESSVDFMVLKSQGTRSLADAWETLTFDTPRENLVLHHGPYPLSDLKKLVDQVRQGKQLNYPRSQLYGLRDTFKQGRQASALAFLYQQARSSDEVKAFLEEFSTTWSDKSKETPPWFFSRSLREGREEYRTAWADLADLWDWIE